MSLKMEEIDTRVIGAWLMSHQQEQTEVEAKFGTFKNTSRIDAYGHRSTSKRFYPGVPWPLFDRLRQKLTSMVEEHHEHATIHIHNNTRKIIYSPSQPEGRERIVWQKKSNKSHIDMPQFRTRVSLNIEEPQQPIRDFTPSLIRERDRYSYIIGNGNIRVDMSIVKTLSESDKEEEKKEGTPYEVEVEFVGAHDRIELFKGEVANVWRWLHDSYLLYTFAERQDIVTYVDNILGRYTEGGEDPVPYPIIDRRNLVDARNIKLRDLVSGGIVGNRRTEYTATIKVDGIRKMLVIHPKGIWLIFPPYEYNLLFRAKRGLGSDSGVGTIFDGEMVPPLRRREGVTKAPYLYYVFDCIAYQEEIGIQQRRHADRMMAGANFIRRIRDKLGNIIDPRTKDFFSLSLNYEADSYFFKVIRRLMKERAAGLLGYDDDGIIFTPESPPYNPHSERYPISERVLTRHPDVCKWKPPSRITIDFAFRKGRGGIELYTTKHRKKGEKRELVLFTGTARNPFTSSMIDGNHVLTTNLPDDTIVEYGWDKERELLVPIIIRHDKGSPNREDVAQDDWDDIHDPIYQGDLEGETFKLLYRYHNRLKKRMLNSLAPGNTLLDIGSGRGGDVAKWGKLGKILAVEPDVNVLPELQRRIEVLHTSNVRMLNAGGEETDTITKHVQQWIGGRVNAASLMLSLSFFWRDSERLQALVETLSQNVKVGGKVLFLTINGDAVSQLFEPVLGGVVLGDFIDIGPATLRLGPEDKGRSLLVTLPGTILGSETGTQEEWLVHIGDLQLRLREKGFRLVTINRAETEPFLPIDAALFTSLYSFGFFERIGGPSTITPVIPSTITPPIKDKPSAVSPVIPSTITPPIKDKPLAWLPVKVSNINQPAIGDDVSESVACTWYNNVVRIATIGDGSCFIHAVCKAIYPPYQENNKAKFRLDLATRIRSELALMLGRDNPAYEGRTYWETTANGAFPRMLMQEIKDPDLVRQLRVDYSLQGLMTLFNSKAWLGNETYAYIAEAFNIDVYVLQGTVKDLYLHSSTRKEGVDKWAAVIMGTEAHFEVVAIATDQGLQTTFAPDDPFIVKIRSMSEGPGMDAEYRPDEAFLRDLEETFTDRASGELVLPSNIETILPSTDPFTLAVKRAKESLI